MEGLNLFIAPSFTIVKLYSIAEIIGALLDFIGVLVILFGVIIATAIYIVHRFGKKSAQDDYEEYRQNLGRGILLGLEILVAGDIIRSISGKPSFTSIGVLAMIVAIRTFLSYNFDMEIYGRWPWQKAKK